MAWIESHQTLREHPKVYLLCGSLSIEKAQAVGHLHLLWWWCVDYAPDGRIKHNDQQIARAAEWSGDSKHFVDSLISSGFLDRSDGVLTVHDWQEFRLHYDLMLQRKEKQLQQTRKRVEKYRKKSQKQVSVTKPLHPKLPDVVEGENVTLHVTQCNAPTVPYRTVPYRTVPNRTVPNQLGVVGHFVPPTPQEVMVYCLERKNNVDHDRFINFYASKGWMVGKNKMKDWRAAVRNWENRDRNQYGQTNGTNQQHNANTGNDAERAERKKQLDSLETIVL